MIARALDVLAVLLLLAAGLAFLFGSLAMEHREDLKAIYWMIVGVALVRATSNLARADRASG